MGGTLRVADGGEGKECGLPNLGTELKGAPLHSV